MAETLTLQTACPLDCPDGCSLTVTVREGRLLSVDATPVEQAANPFTAGFICQKVKHHAERVYGDDRVLTPLIRIGAKGSGEFRSATWDEALDLVALKIGEATEKDGAGSILPFLYNSSAGLLGSSYGDRVSAELGWASVDHTICAATMGAAKQLVLGGLLTADPLDIEYAKYIVVWGANPTISNTHLPPLINRAVREGGAKLVVIDPRRTGIASRAHRHLALRPGTDVVLAAAVARHLQHEGLLDSDFISAHSNGIEGFLAACESFTLDRAASITGLSSSDIAEFAQEWATTKPAMLRIGWGMERTFNGGAGITSALALPVLMGHFGLRGAGILHSTNNHVDTSALSSARREVRQAPAPPRRVVSQNDLGEVLNSSTASERVGVLLVQGANPALMNLDQNAVIKGLSREDLFTVVHEQVMTDTCRYADVVLPATTHFEAPDFVSAYGAFVVQQFPAVIDPVGESRTNAEMFAGLGLRFGLQLATDSDSLLAGVTATRPFGVAQSAGTSIQMVDNFPLHDDQRFHLVPPTYVETVKSAEFPLQLISPANNKTINSMFGERYKTAPATLAMGPNSASLRVPSLALDRPASRIGAPVVQLNPADAALRSIVHQQRVTMFNNLGALELTAHVTDDVRPGVVVVAKGFWSKAFGTNGVSLNSLIPRIVEPLAGGACFNDAFVELRPASA
jgi:anaerobic selenocysteine-containing dehydrogenase